jgi:hypothetical protein
MASNLGPGASASPRGPEAGRLASTTAVAWAALLTAVIAFPWLGRGYLFATDWPGPRRFDFPSSLSSTAPILAVLALVSKVVSSELTGKLLFAGIIFGTALAAYHAVPVAGFVPRAVASTIYLFNPFVYGRLDYGQLFLLVGFALLPWVALRSRAMLTDPRITNGLVLAVSLSLLGVVSSHLFLAAVMLVGLLVIAHAMAAPRRREYLRHLMPALLAAVAGTLVASAYWVAPLLLGQGSSAAKLAAISPGDVRAYAVVPDRAFGLLPNVLGLYGFWAENTGRFASMKAFFPLWPPVLVAILVVAALGAAAGFRGRTGLGPWVGGLLLAAGFAAILEVGVSSPLTSWLVTWLDAHLALYRGMRDAGKWAAILALAYSQLAAVGAGAAIHWLRSHPQRLVRADLTYGVAAGLLVALPLAYGNGLLFGLHGQLRPSSYPGGWYAADSVLAADAHPGRTLFLPWHQYLSLSFVNNENRVVISPAASFFSAPIIAGLDPEVPGTSPPTDPEQVALSDLVAERDQGHWAAVLAGLGIKYVLLAREVDWRAYAFLDQQPDLVVVGDYGSIVLYRDRLTR